MRKDYVCIYAPQIKNNSIIAFKPYELSAVLNIIKNKTIKDDIIIGARIEDDRTYDRILQCKTCSNDVYCRIMEYLFINKYTEIFLNLHVYYRPISGIVISSETKNRIGNCDPLKLTNGKNEKTYVINCTDLDYYIENNDKDILSRIICSEKKNIKNNGGLNNYERI